MTNSNLHTFPIRITIFISGNNKLLDTTISPDNLGGNSIEYNTIVVKEGVVISLKGEAAIATIKNSIDDILKNAILTEEVEKSIK